MTHCVMNSKLEKIFIVLDSLKTIFFIFVSIRVGILTFHVNKDMKWLIHN